MRALLKRIDKPDLVKWLSLLYGTLMIKQSVFAFVRQRHRRDGAGRRKAAEEVGKRIYGVAMII